MEPWRSRRARAMPALLCDPIQPPLRISRPASGIGSPAPTTASRFGFAETMTGGPAPPRVADTFDPPWWLRNRHVQSMLASTFARRAPIERRSRPVVAAEQELLLDCGAGVRLQCFRSSPGPAAEPVVVLHGWEGSAQS